MAIMCKVDIRIPLFDYPENVPTPAGTGTSATVGGLSACASSAAEPPAGSGNLGQDVAMTDPLVALWQSLPRDAGVMETTELAFLADGMGWTEWTTAAGGVEITGFRWRTTGADSVEILEIWSVFGLTAVRDAVEWDELEWRGEPPFTLRFDVEAPGAGGGAGRRARRLRLSGTLGGAAAFALVRTEVSFADCRAHRIAPDLGVGIVREAGNLPFDVPRGDPRSRP